jgi:hypothetical protein
VLAARLDGDPSTYRHPAMFPTTSSVAPLEHAISYTKRSIAACSGRCECKRSNFLKAICGTQSSARQPMGCVQADDHSATRNSSKNGCPDTRPLRRCSGRLRPGSSRIVSSLKRPSAWPYHFVPARLLWARHWSALLQHVANPRVAGVVCSGTEMQQNE